MARSTRQQRRERRRAAETAQPEAAGARRAGRQPVPAADGPVHDHARPRDTRRGSFVRESIAELKKVEWPTRSQVVTGTVAVVIACAIVGAYLWVADLAFKNLVQKVLL